MNRARYANHNEIQSEQELGTYTGYDYMEIAADNAELSFLVDCYEAFGWEVDDNGNYYRAYGNRHSTVSNRAKTVLPLKRDRKIANKAELTRLQRNFEACVQERSYLEDKKTSKATTLALIIGFIGTAFMAGSVFAVTANTPHIFLCIVLAVPALIGWILPYPVYRRVAAQETARINVLIEQKYEEIHAICERGSKLIYEK